MNIAEIAKLAGVSPAAVSRYFNPKEGLIPRSLLRNKLMTNEVSLGLIPRSLLRGVSLMAISQMRKERLSVEWWNRRGTAPRSRLRLCGRRERS